KLIYKGLKGDYLVNPNVYVHVVEYRPFYIHGEVQKPGGYPYQPGLTVNQAIALAGGLTERASKDKIYLFKEKNKNKQINASLTYKVNAGDTILIKQRFF
ncbi:putative polysaccharide export-related protein, partial [Moritella sp. PE36]|uniref:polysaccharide biosynthesis/export family protein n=2 Tax=unclassified Moritella TaxID=2637987 RepID=UPI0001568BB0